MRTAVVFFCLGLAAAGPSKAREPEFYLPGEGGNPLDVQLRAIWIDNPDFSAPVVSSEVILGFDLETEVANDFVIEEHAVAREVYWWGTYWNGFDGTPKERPFFLRLYRDAGCIPEASPFLESFTGAYFIEALAYKGDMYSQFIYLACIPETLLSPGIYWLSIQMAEHAFPVQWGRLGADKTQSCDTCIRSEYFGYSEWKPVAEITGSPYDAAQMIEDECFEWGPTKVTSWGAIKGLYR
jgi:hypothetical protein